MRGVWAGDVRADAASRDRSERWKTQPPVVLHPLSREDHYLSEAQWHVQRRNELVGLLNTRLAEEKDEAARRSGWQFGGAR